jgi:hypothetical protein
MKKIEKYFTQKAIFHQESLILSLSEGGKPFLISLGGVPIEKNYFLNVVTNRFFFSCGKFRGPMDGMAKRPGDASNR